MGNEPAFTILNVNDDDAARYAVSRILRQDGFQVLEAASGRQGLRLAGQNPTLIVLDVKLPDISGFEVCQRIKADPTMARTPVLMLSATYLDSRSRVLGLESGADGYLTLPVEPPVLTAYVRALLRTRQAEVELEAVAREWRTTFHAMRDGVCLLDWESRIVRCNQAMADILGRPLNQIVGRPCWQLVHGTSGPIDGCPMVRMSETDRRETLVLGMGDRWFDVAVDPLLNDADDLVGAVHIMTDITERRQAEAALRASHRFLEITNRHTEMLPLLRGFVAELKAFTGCAAVGVRLLDEQGNIPYTAYVGFDQGFYESESPLSIKSDQCMCINVIRGDTDPQLPFYTEGGSFYMNGTTRFLATVSEEEKGRTRNVCNQLGYESVALVPIRLGDRILGLIHVADRREDVVPLEMVRVLEGTAMQLGAAIQRVWAEEALRESHDQLERRVEERTAELNASNASLQREIAGRRRAEEELRKVNRALMTLSDCNQALFRASGESDLLHSICRTIVAVGGYSLAWVGFARQNEAKAVRPVAQAGYEEGYLDTVNITWADTEWGRGPTGTVIRTGKPCICRNILTDPNFAPWRAEAIERGYASSAALPLMADDRTFGALNIYAVESDAFDAQEVNLLAELADNLAYGITALRTRAERRRAEEALKASEQRYRSLFEGVPVGLYRTTPAGQILDVNPALVHMLGYPDSDSLRQVNVSDLYLKPEERRRWQVQVEREGTVHGAEAQYRRRDGTVIWARDTARAVHDADHQVAYYQGYVEDITERKEAQAAMIQAERLAIAGRLAASLTHEINNPLQSVIGCLGLAQEILREGGDVSQYLQVALEELQRAAGVVAQLRSLHRRPRPEERKHTDVNALLERVLTLSRKQCEDCRVEVVWTGAADLPTLLLTADQIQQVFLNLLLNALDAMPRGGRLRVSTTRTDQPAGARIVFADNGVGIGPDVLTHVFEPFHSTKPQGLGLGLFITGNILREHGGHIEVESQVGEGTTFTVWLPG